MAFIYLRIGIYLILTVAIFQTVVAVVPQSSAPHAFFKEDGPWEWAEFCVLAGAGLLVLWAAHIHKGYTGILRVCGLLAFFAALRELDLFLAKLVFEDAYKWINGLILALVVYVLWKHRKDLTLTLTQFSQTAPFYFFVCALLVLVVGELMAQKAFWTAITGGSHMRAVSRATEELGEFMAYLLFLLGAIEAYFLRDR